MIYIKISGLLILFFVCCATGFYFSKKLTKRRKTMEEICLAMDEIPHLIRLGEERGKILKKVFEARNLCVFEDENYIVKVACASLKDEDISILNEYFFRLGSGDVASQLSLCAAYKKLLNMALEGARQEEKAKGQLYKTCGVLTAVAMVIFII